MTEKEVLTGLQQIDSLLARCVDPALTRADHDAVRNIMLSATERVRLSYQLETEKIGADAEKLISEPKK